jgi:hypothetical protein
LPFTCAYDIINIERGEDIFMIKKNQDKEWYKKFRNLWDRNPITRIKPSNNIYSRNKIKKESRREINGE